MADCESEAVVLAISVRVANAAVAALPLTVTVLLVPNATSVVPSVTITFNVVASVPELTVRAWPRRRVCLLIRRFSGCPWVEVYGPSMS